MPYGCIKFLINKGDFPHIEKGSLNGIVSALCCWHSLHEKHELKQQLKPTDQIVKYLCQSDYIGFFINNIFSEASRQNVNKDDDKAS